MNVLELINKLEQYDDSLEVMLEDVECRLYKIDNITTSSIFEGKDIDIVILATP